MKGSVVLWAVIGAVLAAIGQLLFKVGATGRQTVLEFVNPAIIAGLGMYALGTVLWLFALSKANLNIIYPFAMLTMVLVGLGSVFLLREPVSTQTVIGWSIVVIGLVVIASSR